MGNACRYGQKWEYDSRERNNITLSGDVFRLRSGERVGVERGRKEEMDCLQDLCVSIV